MFVKPSSALFLLLSASRLASASLVAKIGYSAVLVPGLPGPEPGIGCGLWAQASTGSETASGNFGGNQPTDDCPAADVALFCGRWGCPFQMTFAGVVGLTVNSDNSGDKSISVTAVGLNGGTTTVNCPWTPETISQSDSITIYSAWSCDVSGVQP
ncbi:uncharacterized protein TrAtP1_000590 [Trichoderma atroviride]|uniref:Uncharacterized protein n=1 Tax=Hypocrea atroviridis (strain ATCC 20476 / IMI 206040) TaxID=452589 RepID=G9NLV6_HYPAI|nr:uncharacterized protein TRIATDRAFT_305654 [Trichoderma atroviride IMI 206040]EHK47891.1 hypothetical protein TRIATDRAFT_305654 [Trichoderma atroviride IMI 206040]UKZ59271.1 hypothetical protein TrAtP1_000590 [Trichoderma atroviride]